MNPDINSALNHPIFKVAKEVSTVENTEAYVVGGFVRDFFMGNKSSDIDITVVGNGPEFAQKVADKLKVKKVTIEC